MEIVGQRDRILNFVEYIDHKYNLRLSKNYKYGIIEEVFQFLNGCRSNFHIGPIKFTSFPNHFRINSNL